MSSGILGGMYQMNDPSSEKKRLPPNTLSTLTVWEICFSKDHSYKCGLSSSQSLTCFPREQTGEGPYWGRGPDPSSVAPIMYFYWKCNKLCLSYRYKIVSWYHFHLYLSKKTFLVLGPVLELWFLLFTHSVLWMKTMLPNLGGAKEKKEESPCFLPPRNLSGRKAHPCILEAALKLVHYSLLSSTGRCQRIL